MLAHSLHEIFHAIFYVLNSGCPRRLGSSLPLVNARGWGERPSGPIEESEHLLDSVWPRHTPDHTAEESLIPLEIPPLISIALQSRLKRLCSRGADSRRPKGPNRADNGSNRLLYASIHIEVWTARLLLSDRGAELLTTPAPSRPRENGRTQGFGRGI
jgi:hypothetical protein